MIYFYSLATQKVAVMPEWRNWQTHQTQNLALATTYRFKSDFRHHLKSKASRVFLGAFFVPIFPRQLGRVD